MTIINNVVLFNLCENLKVICRYVLGAFGKVKRSYSN